MVVAFYSFDPNSFAIFIYQNQGLFLFLFFFVSIWLFLNQRGRSWLRVCFSSVPGAEPGNKPMAAKKRFPPLPAICPHGARPTPGFMRSGTGFITLIGRHLHHHTTNWCGIYTVMWECILPGSGGEAGSLCLIKVVCVYHKMHYNSFHGEMTTFDQYMGEIIINMDRQDAWNVK